MFPIDLFAKEKKLDTKKGNSEIETTGTQERKLQKLKKIEDDLSNHRTQSLEKEGKQESEPISISPSTPLFFDRPSMTLNQQEEKEEIEEIEDEDSSLNLSEKIEEEIEEKKISK